MIGKPADLMEAEFGSQEEADVLMLEALLKSPAWAALKRALDVYRSTCYSQIMEKSDPHELFEIKGRLLGLKFIENIPGVLVSQRNQKLKQVELATRYEKPKEKEFKPVKP